jgi:hypothetical protein
LIDKATVTLDGKDQGVYYEAAYPRFDNANIFTDVVETVINEDEKAVTNYEVKVYDQQLNPIEPPEEGKEPTKLPVGFYVVEVNGRGTYAGSAYAILHITDGDPEEAYSFTPSSKTLESNYDGTVWSGDYDVAGTIPTHTLTVTASDKDVAITYSVNGGEATAEAPTFTEVGNYEVTVTGKKANYADLVKTYTVHVWKTEVYVWVDNATTTYGVDPTVNYRLTYTDEDQTPFADESVLGLEITTIAGEPITGLDVATYVLSAKFDNENYRPIVKGGIYQSQAPTLTVEKANLEDATIKISPKSYVYDGKTKKPTVTVTYMGMTLVQGVDYKLIYANNKKAGTAKAIITGKEKNFTGTKTGSFKITKATQKVAAVSPKSGATKTFKAADLQKAAKTFTIKATASKEQGTAQFKKVKGNAKITISSAGKVTVKKGLKAGKYTLKYKVRVKATTNYKATKYAQKTIKIVVK